METERKYLVFLLAQESYPVIYCISQLEELTQASHQLGLKQASSNSSFKSFWIIMLGVFQP